jgi:glycosyltransferase involved in cell wall biosynthesis
MWESGKTPTTVIEHGVTVPPGVRYSGELTRGLVIANHIQQHSRRSGEDVFKRVRLETPLDLVGAQSEALGGLGYIPPDRLPAFAARYRFVFSPSRYTSLSLALCEAMMLGLPIIGLATTELVAVVHNGVSGYLDTDISRLIDAMQLLLGDHAEAARLGQGARRLALQRFNIQRFARDWEAVFEVVTGKPVAPRPPLRKPIQSSVDMGE